ncbi:MAG: MFS transporter [Verrucomicrobia bacterium]|nr:MAG: MFS transporter [Verrucomicrobiota bacterium]
MTTAAEERPVPQTGTNAHREAPTTEIPPEDRIPVHQKAAFGAGIVADHCATFGLNSFTLPIFNVVLGLSPTLVSTALGIARLWDAFNDPFLGSLSDNCRSRWGRRRPFLFVGAILTGAFFPLIWWASPSWSHTGLFIYLSIALILHYTFYTLYSVPYQSIGMELTPNYRERTNLYAWMAYVQQISGLAVPWMLALASLSVFPDLLTGTRVVAAGVGLLIIVCGLMPAIFCRERFGEIAKHQPKEHFWTSLRSMAKNGPLVILVGSIGIYLLAISTTQVFDFYVHTYYIFEGNIKHGATLTGLDGTVRAASAMLGAFLIQRLSKHYGKRHLLLACVTVIFLCKVGIYFTYIPGNPYLTFVTKPFVAMAETGFWVLIISMRADVADYDEYTFGRRREGMIAAVNNWLAKLAMTLATVFGGLLLDYVIGYDRALGGNQTPETMERMLLCYVILPSAAAALIFLLLWKYPLTQHRLGEIRAELEARRSKV